MLDNQPAPPDREKISATALAASVAYTCGYVDAICDQIRERISFTGSRLKLAQTGQAREYATRVSLCEVRDGR